MESSHFVQYSAARGRFVVGGGRGVVNGMENHKSGIASQQGKKPDRQERRGRQTNLKGEGGWLNLFFLPAAKMEGQGQSNVQITMAFHCICKRLFKML